MLKLTSLDEKISEYYDEELKASDLLSYEARMARSKCVRDYTNERCFEFFKITSSIKRVDRRLKNYQPKNFEQYKKFLKKNILVKFHDFISNLRK